MGAAPTGLASGFEGGAPPTTPSEASGTGSDPLPSSVPAASSAPPSASALAVWAWVRPRPSPGAPLSGLSPERSRTACSPLRRPARAAGRWLPLPVGLSVVSAGPAGRPVAPPGSPGQPPARPGARSADRCRAGPVGCCWVWSCWRAPKSAPGSSPAAAAGELPGSSPLPRVSGDGALTGCCSSPSPPNESARSPAPCGGACPPGRSRTRQGRHRRAQPRRRCCGALATHRGAAGGRGHRTGTDHRQRQQARQPGEERSRAALRMRERSPSRLPPTRRSPRSMPAPRPPCRVRGSRSLAAAATLVCAERRPSSRRLLSRAGRTRRGWASSPGHDQTRHEGVGGQRPAVGVERPRL
jgi:hypothetical protein